MAEQAPEEFFAGHPLGLAVYHRVHGLVTALGPVDVLVSRSQVAFRRRRGFGYLWLPGRWLAHPSAEVVPSIALPRHDGSPRFRQVAHQAPTVWMHHLDVSSEDDLDDDVAEWLQEAYELAG